MTSTNYSHFTTSELHLMASAVGASADERRDIVDEIGRRSATGSPSAIVGPQRVIITGVEIPFRDWVNILVMIALAAIPAMLVLIVVGIVIVMLLGGVGEIASVLQR